MVGSSERVSLDDSMSMGHLVQAVRRSLSEFLAVPIAIIGCFLLLAALTSYLDAAGIDWLASTRAFLRRYVFGDASATSELLTEIAAGLITVTSITLSILLLAVQQTAASMTSVVFDQFMRRKANQVFFGFFVGLALFALVVLSTVRAGYNPVIGATSALVLSIFALIFVIVLIYTAINQMRPAVIVEAIHHHTLRARMAQLDLIHQTRRTPTMIGVAACPVSTSGDGVVSRIDLRLIGEAAGDGQSDVEVVLLVSVGSFVAFGDTIAEIRAERADDLERLEHAVRRAVHLDRMRDLDHDPAFGIEQLTNIAWTSMSTSKQNPRPGLLIIHSLRDLLARWTAAAADDPDSASAPVVYPDNLLDELLDAFETLAVVCTESMQQQNFAEIINTFAIMFDRLPHELQRRAEDLILRALAGMGDLMPTHELDQSLSALVNTLARAGRSDTADAVRTAQATLAQSIGRLNSRSTRVPSR